MAWEEERERGGGQWRACKLIPPSSSAFWLCLIDDSGRMEQKRGESLPILRVPRARIFLSFLPTATAALFPSGVDFQHCVCH